MYTSGSGRSGNDEHDYTLTQQVNQDQGQRSTALTSTRHPSNVSLPEPRTALSRTPLDHRSTVSLPLPGYSQQPHPHWNTPASNSANLSNPSVPLSTTPQSNGTSVDGLSTASLPLPMTSPMYPPPPSMSSTSLPPPTTSTNWSSPSVHRMPQQHQFPLAPLHTNALSSHVVPTSSFGSFQNARPRSSLSAISNAVNVPIERISPQIVDAPANWRRSTSNVAYMLSEALESVGEAEARGLQGLQREQQRAIDETRSQLDQFIRTGDLPDPPSADAARIIRLASPDNSPHPSPRTGPTALGQLPNASAVARATSRRTNATPDGTSQAENLATPIARRNAVIRAMLVIWANETRSTPERLLNSAANSLMRNVLSVMLPTMLRQIIAQEFATYSQEHLSENGRIGFALIVAMIPPVLLMAGHQNSGHATRNANISRNTLALASIAAVAAAAGTGTLGSAAPAVFAFLLYAGMRDTAQSFIRLADPGNDDLIPVRTSAMSASAYAGYQMGSGELAANRESPSGAGAAGLPLAARNSVLRGFTNQLVETADDLTLGALAARAANQPLKLTLSGRIPSGEQALSTLTTTFPARATLAIADTLASGAISSALAHTGLDPATQNHLSNVLDSVVLGLMYPAYIHINEENPQVQRPRESPSRSTPSTFGRGAIAPAIVVTSPGDRNAMEMLRPSGDAVSHTSATGSMRSVGAFERGEPARATPSVRSARTASSGTSVMRRTGNFDRGSSTGSASDSRRRLPQNDD